MWWTVERAQFLNGKEAFDLRSTAYASSPEVVGDFFLGLIAGRRCFLTPVGRFGGCSYVDGYYAPEWKAFC